jgi:putative ABC transport system ATP-binding protein
MPVKIEFESVSYQVPSGDEAKAEILRDISFSVPEGRNFTILGPSGSGKSTLLRLCNRLIEPSQGVIRYDGRVLDTYPVAQLRRKVGLVFQTRYYFKI